MQAKHFIKGLIVFCLGFPTAVLAQSVAHNIAACQLSDGHPVFCGLPFTGDAVLPLTSENGRYYRCSVTVGNATFCKAPYTGNAVVQQLNGQYASCLIELGEVKFCSLPYTGRAVIRGW
ncbi:hypothetical protein ACJRO0_05195 [Acetobacter oryzifermentans]|uniref:hypothetical protein n=1 Tax=Acetobacter oryzifermentans TaxID=1633874 RepID=UPI0039BFC95A